MTVADDKKLFELDGFTGLNTVDKAAELRAVRTGDGRLLYPLTQAENINVTNAFKIHGRQGYSLLVSGTHPHSLYGTEDAILFVEGDKMYAFNVDENPVSVTEVARGMSPGRWMSYDAWNSRIYYSNGYQIGYIEDLVNHSLTIPTQAYKGPMPPGQRIAYYRGRLYVAQNNILWISDVMADYIDMRKGFFQFSAEITMLRPVENGIYVSYGGETHFLNGKDPEDMSNDHAISLGCIPFTDIVVDGRYFGKEDEGGMAAWVSEEGVCAGDNKGNVLLYTPTYKMSGAYMKGAALFIDEPGDQRIVEVLN